MAKSKTLASGKKVMTGSKADPDSKRYVAKTPTPSTSKTTSSSKSSLGGSSGGSSGGGAIDSTYNYDSLKETPEQYTSRVAVYNASKGESATADENGTTGTESMYSKKEKQGQYYPRYTSADDLPPVEVKTEEELQRSKTRAAQGEINALRELEKSMLQEQSVINEGRSRGVASVNTLTGLAGSDEANVKTNEAMATNKQANDKIRNATSVDIARIFKEIRTEAATEARQSRIDARTDETASIANTQAKRQMANERLKTLAAAGVTLTGLKTKDPSTYNYFLQQYGDEESLKGAFILNTPADQILDKQIKNGSYVIAKQNPITGKISVETLDLGLPPEYNDTIDAGDVILAVPEGWDGDPNKLVSIPKGLSPKDAADGMPTAADIEKAQIQKNEALTLAIELRDDLAVGKKSAVGASLEKVVPFGKESGLQGDRVAYESKVNTLKSNLTLENLKLLKGAMSDKDLLFLNAIGSSLDVNMSEAQFNKELDRVIEKLKTSGAQGGSSGVSPEERQQLKSEGYTDEEIDGLSFNGVGGDTKTATRPQRNNNPLNIKASAYTTKYPGVAGVDPSPATDGGKFLVFATADAGFDAATRLLRSEGYTNLTVDQAMKRWSNSGYGGEIAPSLRGKKVNQLTAAELDSLVKLMAKREGFYA